MNSIPLKLHRVGEGSSQAHFSEQSHAARYECESSVPFKVSPFEAREHTLRTLVKKWFGPLETINPAARRVEFLRREACLESVLRLHRISWNLAPDDQKGLLPEEDVFAALTAMNRLSLALDCTTGEIADYCESQVAKDGGSRALQLDPLQLRHILTFHHSVPHRELNMTEINALRALLHAGDVKHIRTWFMEIIRKKPVLPKDTGQYLRHLLMELIRSNSDVVDAFATEVAVLDVALLDVIGWENSRLFFSVMKRIEGRAFTRLKVFMNLEDIGVALAQYAHLKLNDEVVHFRGQSIALDPDALRRLERTIFAAATERSADPEEKPVAAAAPAKAKPILLRYFHISDRVA